MPAWDPKSLPLVYGDDVVEQYADGIAECTFLNGVLHLSFWRLRTDASSEPLHYYRKVTMKLVVSMSGAIELHDWIGKLMAQLESQGMIQRPSSSRLHTMPGPETKQ